MLSIKTDRNKIYKTYLEWLNPLLHLSKGEQDILSTMLQLQYNHRYYPIETLNSLLLSEDTKEHIRKRLKINRKLFDKLYSSLEKKQLISKDGIHSSLIKYPKDGKLKIFISIECNK